MISCIYTITSPSGKQYVGSATDLDRRWAKHLRDLRGNVHGNCNLQRAAAKYEVENLIFKVILICRRCDLLMYEQRAIDLLNPAYNIARVAGNGIGIKRSAEFRAKISAALRGRKVSAETREKIAAKQRDKKMSPDQVRVWHSGLRPVSLEERRRLAAFMHTPEAKRKKAIAMIGHQVSPETRYKISAALTGKKRSPEQISRIRAGIARSAALRALALQSRPVA